VYENLSIVTIVEKVTTKTIVPKTIPAIAPLRILELGEVTITVTM